MFSLGVTPSLRCMALGKELYWKWSTSTIHWICSKIHMYTWIASSRRLLHLSLHVMEHAIQSVCQIQDTEYGHQRWLTTNKLTSAPQLKSLPPTTHAFKQHVHHAHFQAAIWRSSLDPDPPALNPVEYGWSLNGSTQDLESVPLPYDVSPAPMDVLKLIKCVCASKRPCSTARSGWRWRWGLITF